MDQKSQLALHPPGFGRLEAVPSVVPAKWWRRRPVSSVAVAVSVACAVGACAVGATAQPSQAAIASRKAAGAQPESGLAVSAPPVSIAVSNIYDITVPAGTWVPLAIWVTNRRASDLQGTVVLSVPASPLASGQSCYSNGASFVCTTSGFGQPSSYASNIALPTVTYKIPLSLAGGTEKQLTAYVLADSPYGHLLVTLRGPSGRLLATTSTRLPVAYGTPPPAVLVVTNNSSGLPVMANLVTPTGSHPQIQYILPEDLPGSAAALGAFGAVAIDEADTSVLSPAQVSALESYVDAGGTLVVAGGLAWSADTAGLPAGLLPATVEGIGPPMALPALAGLVGAPPPEGTVDVDILDLGARSSATITERRTPLAVQAGLGAGQVTFSAFDPAAPPLASWPGTPAVLSRLFASAYQDVYYGQPSSLGGGLVPANLTAQNMGTAPMTNLGAEGGGSALLSPAAVRQGLLGYLEDLPSASPPGAYVLGLLLLGYVVLIGPFSFWALTRTGRRELAWLVVPCLAVGGGLGLYVTGAGTRQGPVTDEVRVAQLAPGSDLAQVVSLGAVYLPMGGSHQVQLGGQFSVPPTLVGDLGAVGGAQLTVGAGNSSAPLALTVDGPSNSLGGWAAAGTARLAGTVLADVDQSDGQLTGEVTNDLGVDLRDAQVVVASGQAQRNLGTMRTGITSRFSLPVPSSNLAQNSGFESFPLALGPGSGTGSQAARRQAAVESLFDLGAIYSAEEGGAPVLVAFANGPLFPRDLDLDVSQLDHLDRVATSSSRVYDPTDAIIVPLVPGAVSGGAVDGLGPELVGSRHAVEQTANGLAAGSFAASRGGSLYYQFLLPGTHWARAELDFGSISPSYMVPGISMTTSGQWAPEASVSPRALVVSAFDYERGNWSALPATSASGDLVATVDRPARYLGPGGVLEIRLSAVAGGLLVSGAVPMLSAVPGLAGQ
jgi:hypothetical protein